MVISLTIKNSWIGGVKRLAGIISPEQWVAVAALFLAVASTAYSFAMGYIISYGDAESHLNIAKRVVDSLTPGFAQLGGIWLPLPHLLLIPFVYSDFLWRTGLAGSIVSGACFIVSAVFLYKTVFLVSKNRAAALFGALVFILNPNILYLQTTPMSELVLIVFFILSTYYFIKYVGDQSDLPALLLAAFYGFCATISRYDGWFLVAIEAVVLILLPLAGAPKSPGKFWQFAKSSYKKIEGKAVLFSTLAFFGIILWFGWGWLILGDPLYFTDSDYSAKSQQLAWAARNELPGKGHAVVSFLYYFVTSMSNAGVIMFTLAIFGLAVYLFKNKSPGRWFVAAVLLAPFIFNVLSLYLGQSVIFIPSLTPTSYDWTLFNVRYGVMMVPCVAFCAGYLFSQIRPGGRSLLAILSVLQIGLFVVGYSPVISMQDGVVGLSSEIHQVPDAQYFVDKNYDGGLVLQDDFARTISIIKSPIPMKNTIYVGNKPYYQESLQEPEKYARWIFMQQNDEIWKALYDDPAMQGRLYKYFTKVYTSPTILIFKRNNVPEQS
ncbi:MAG: hypothetical protein P4L74_06655 [Candidatus Doudnabacteria bacterium]|nr:hypothetical protein [Candidatus Doudnabacteria bacterium]